MCKYSAGWCITAKGIVFFGRMTDSVLDRMSNRIAKSSLDIACNSALDKVLCRMPNALLS